MQPASDESADEILEILSNLNEGDEAIPNVTKDSKGDTPSPKVRFSEGRPLVSKRSSFRGRFKWKWVSHVNDNEPWDLRTSALIMYCFSTKETLQLLFRNLKVLCLWSIVIVNTWSTIGSFFARARVSQCRNSPLQRDQCKLWWIIEWDSSHGSCCWEVKQW